MLCPPMPFRHYSRLRISLTGRVRACIAWAVLTSAPGIATTHRTSGTVIDSLPRPPWQPPIVQLAPDTGAARQALTDSLGAFRFDSVAPGKYRIGFFHA